MKRLGTLAMVGLCLFAPLAVAGQSAADVRIVNISLSPQVLMQIYANYKNGGPLTWPNDQLLMIAVESGQDEPAFTFRIDIRHGRNVVASAEPFELKPLARGMNTFGANQLAATNLSVSFNSDYIPADLSKGITPNTLPTGQYVVVLTPLNPRGPAYTVTLPLFTPPSALNMPPIAIYPKEVQVNTQLPTFTWTQVQKAKDYEILVSTDQDPGVNTHWKSERVAVNQLMYAPSARTLENGQRYYWQVRAYDDFGKPVGGVDGKSQPVWFQVNSGTHLASSVTPAEVDAAFRAALPDRVNFQLFDAYTPVAVETTSPDLAGLLRQLRGGSLRVLSVEVE